MLTRRDLVAGTAAALGTVALESKGFGSEALVPLRDTAASRQSLFGAAVHTRYLSSDNRYVDLVAKQANILVCEGEMKRRTLQPHDGPLNFKPADSIFRFAKKNGQQMRGHTLMWHESMPEWLENKLTKGAPEKLITDYISAVVGRYAGRVHSWDVVNECIAAETSDKMRDTPWLRAFGESYIDTAFHSAHQADPGALLFINELNAEANEWWGEGVRVGLLDLIDRLLKRNVPIQAVGLESHLKVYRARYDDEIISKFMDEIIARGLKIMITELDVADIDGPSDPAVRDADVASLTKRYLDVAFSKKEMLGCLTWGITNKYSWLNVYDNYKRPDGQFSRALPFDENYAPTPMFKAIEAAYRGR